MWDLRKICDFDSSCRIFEAPILYPCGSTEPSPAQEYGLFNPLIHAPPPSIFALYSKYLKILDLAKLFVADATMKKKNLKI